MFVVTLLERLFDLYRESRDLPDALAKAWSGEHADHFLAMNIAVGLTLLVYKVYGEIDRHLGEGALRKLFFGPALPQEPAGSDPSRAKNGNGLESER